MISKVVFFRYIPLTELICKSHFMDWMMDNGILVEYLDFSNLFYPNYEFTDKIEKDYTININSYKEFKVYLNDQNKDKTLFISIVTFEWRVFRLFRILTQNNCKLAVFGRGMIPLPSVTSGTKIKKLINLFSLKKIDAFLKNRISYFGKKYGWIKRYDVIFLTGIKALSPLGVGFRLDYEKAKIFDVNTADYDNFLEFNNIASFTAPYAIFLDENLPSHPDTKLFNIDTIEANDYYPELNAFFDKLERDFRVKIIIAAHPKAINYENSNPFDGREIYFNKVNELIANCDFVIAHDSTSIGYAVLHMKPILSITSLKLKQTLPANHECTISFSKFLNSCLIYFDNYNRNGIYLNIDKEKYNSYKFTYLTTQKTQNTLTKTVFIESLKQV